VRSVLIDTSPRPQDLARRIAQEMNAAYVPLPQAGAEAVSAAVRMGMDQAARSQAS
jgi:magnesium chelatase subunit D